MTLNASLWRRVMNCEHSKAVQGTSADLTALEKKGLDQKTNHQGFTKAKTKEIIVLIKAIEEKETVGLKLWQSAKEVTQRPPWRDKCNRGREFGVAHTLALGARGCKPRRRDEIQPLCAHYTQYQKHHTNDADE